MQPHAAVSCLENSCEEPGFNRSLLDTMTQVVHPGQQRSGDTVTKEVSHLSNTRYSLNTIVDLSLSSGVVSQQVDPSGLSQQTITGRSCSAELRICTSGNSDIAKGGKVNGFMCCS